jgi:hypothetical protein
MRRIGAALAILIAVGASTGFTGAAASAAPPTSPVEGTWGPAVAVPGLSALSPEGVEVVTSISCAAPRNCGAGGNLGGGKGRPYAVVANETPVK